MEEYLSVRKGILQDAKKISTQIKDLSKDVLIELQKKEEKSDISIMIEEEPKNVKTELNSIKEKNIRKLIYIIIGLFILVFILFKILQML